MRIAGKYWYVAAWLFIIGLSLAGGYFNAVLTDSDYHLRSELPFLSRWVVWLTLTPLALRSAERKLYAGSAAGSFLVYHFAVYVLLCAVHVFVASLLATGIASLCGLPHSYAVVLRKCALTGVFYNFVVYAIVVLLVNSLQHYRRLRDEQVKTAQLETSLVTGKLQFLRQQLEPHFLFNTHHSIITLMKTGQKEKAVEMMEKLSELMRIALRENKEQQIPLRKEIETLLLYTDIQKIRFGNKLQVATDIPADLQAALVPGMILQPLVENSIKYAVERNAKGAQINIAAERLNGHLVLTVKDKTESGAAPTVIKGIGLSNTEERLLQLYNSQAFMYLDPYANGLDAGLNVTLKIPYSHA